MINNLSIDDNGSVFTEIFYVRTKKERLHEKVFRRCKCVNWPVGKYDRTNERVLREDKSIIWKNESE